MLPSSLQKLIYQLNKLPGIGPKTAERLGFWLIKKPQAELDEFARDLQMSKKDLIDCPACHNISDKNPCAICNDASRDHQTICVVADVQDLQAFERLKSYQGLYHVLGGVLNPLENIGPDHLNIESLFNRIKNDHIKEIILGLNPDLEGESTVQYLYKTLKPFDLKVTRLARGLPTGSDIEYADEITLTGALKNRREV
jgi:recombination protein RecR